MVLNILLTNHSDGHSQNFIIKVKNKLDSKGTAMPVQMSSLHEQ